jgi:hypothetical protein
VLPVQYLCITRGVTTNFSQASTNKHKYLKGPEGLLENLNKTSVLPVLPMVTYNSDVARLRTLLDDFMDSNAVQLNVHQTEL